MKSFPALTIIALLYRLLAVLIAILSILLAVGEPTLQDGVFLAIAGVFLALVIYAVGEGILLVIDLHRQQCISTEAQIRTYKALQGTGKPIIKRLKQARRMG